MDTTGINEEQPAQNNALIASPQSGQFLHPSLESRLKDILTLLPDAFLYVILSEQTQLRKIGITDNLERRLKQLQDCSAYPLSIEVSYRCVKGTEVIFERFIHSLFAHKRTHGEWFLLDDEDMVFLHGRCPLNLRMDKIGSGKDIKTIGAMALPKSFQKL